MDFVNACKKNFLQSMFSIYVEINEQAVNCHVKKVVKYLAPVRAHQLQLQGWNTGIDIIQKALPHVKRLTGLHGRWEVIHHNPTVILDVGHNVDGMAQITKQIELSDYHHLHIIIGMVKDKEIDAVLKLLPKHATYYFTRAQIPRALDAVSLLENAKRLGLNGNAFDNVNTALQHAISHAHTKDMILVCGSVFLVGEVSL